MPDGTSETRTQARARGVENILVVLREHYYDDYHLEYVRLFSLGVARKDFPARLKEAGFGSHCQEAVDFHLDRLHKRFSLPKNSSDAATLLAEAYERYCEEPRKPAPPKPTVDTTWVPSAEHVPHKGTLSDNVDRSKWSIRFQGNRSRKEADLDDSSGASSSAEKMPTSFDGFSAPSDDELKERIRGLSPTKLRQLTVLVSYGQPPTQNEISVPFGLEPPSAAASVSGIHTALGLGVPNGFPPKRRKEWSAYRHDRLRNIFGAIDPQKS